MKDTVKRYLGLVLRVTIAVALAFFGKMALGALFADDEPENLPNLKEDKILRIPDTASDDDEEEEKPEPFSVVGVYVKGSINWVEFSDGNVLPVDNDNFRETRRFVYINGFDEPFPKHASKWYRIEDPNSLLKPVFVQ